ncbi:glycosyltransferase family 2 protein [Patescibacteria group bacterium]
MKNKINKPLVSVVIPVFNGTPYLEEAVASVQKSKYRNIEIILINDGSTDKSKELCQKLDKRYKNIRFYNFDKNRGLGRVLNHALKHGKGKYVCRLNQDDRMLPHRISTEVEYLESHPDVTVVGSWIKLFHEDGKEEIVRYLKTDEKIKKVWLYLSPFADPTVMYRRDVALKVGGYDQNFWPGDDTQLWYKMGMAGRLANIPRPLVEVRWHTGAASVVHFRRLALVTYKIHRWAHKNVRKAPLHVQAYWIVCLIAGFTLHPQFNWSFYRQMKKVVALYEDSSKYLRKLKRKIRQAIVAIQPKKFSLSGV